MIDGVFYWIGVGVVGTLAFLIVAFVLVFFYVNFLHGRFGIILFRKGNRRLSLASWFNSRLMNDDYFQADDWPVNERPFYLSYEIGTRRLFILAGLLGPRRDSPIKGKHPNETERGE